MFLELLSILETLVTPLLRHWRYMKQMIIDVSSEARLDSDCSSEELTCKN